MRGTLYVRFLILLLAQLLALPVWAKSTFTDVPRNCELLLKRLGHTNRKAEVLKGNIDWSIVLDNMEAIGYPRRIAKGKLSEIHWDDERVLDNIRRSLDKPSWNWGTPLTARDSRLIGDYNAPEFVAALPFWDSLIGFDSSEAVHAYLKETSYLDEKELKQLANYAPLWLTGRRANANAMRLFELTKDDDVGHAWILQITRDFSGRALIERAIRRHFRKELHRPWDAARTSPGERADSLLSILASLPYEKLPAGFRKVTERYWLALDKYPPLRMDNITHISAGYESAGDCEMMSYGHLRSMGLACSTKDNDQWKKSVLIRVQGHVIGSLKLVGDPSMIALRNVENSDGQLVLALGGVYHISKDAYDEVKKRGQKGFRGWRMVDLKRLAVHPMAFLLNSNSWSDSNVFQIISAAEDAFSKDDLIEILKDRSDNRHFELDTESLTAMHEKVWPEILKRLDAFRRTWEPTR